MPDNLKTNLPFNNDGNISESSVKTPEQRKQDLDTLIQRIDDWCDNKKGTTNA